MPSRPSKNTSLLRMLARAAAAGRATRVCASACAPSAASVWAGCASSTGARRLQSSTSRETSPREYAEDAFEHPDDAPGLRRPKAMEVASSIVSAVKDDQSKHENRVRSRDDCIFAEPWGLGALLVPATAGAKRGHMRAWQRLCARGLGLDGP
jgi:hypothetical protein